MKLEDLYSSDEFEEMINQALVNACTEWEMQFVDDLYAKWEQWGMDVFITQRQADVLYRLGGQ
jgi:hypothetical protein